MLFIFSLTYVGVESYWEATGCYIASVFEALHWVLFVLRYD